MGNLAYGKKSFESSQLSAGFEFLPLLIQAVPMFSSFIKSAKVENGQKQNSLDFADLLPKLLAGMQNVEPQLLEQLLTQVSTIMPGVEDLLKKEV